MERKKLGIHIPFKKLQTDLLIKAIHCVQSDEYKNKVQAMGANLRQEPGVENAANALEKYFEAPGPDISGKRGDFRSRSISKKYFGMLLLLLAVFFSNVSIGQNQAEKIRQIRVFCQSINANRSLTQKTVDEETLFQGNTPDGGGSLVGYFEKGELCKMDFTVGLSYGEITKSYYLEQGHLVFLYLKEKVFPVKAGADSLDLRRLQPSFEGRYYFDKDTLIDKVIRGKKRLNDGSLPDFPREARELARMLNATSK